eukprot:TRINITY_DN31913_c0_g1_i1.p2 TRINITY_DN31913_c0_g1~~TRINITY_DN31913_c0_g1_i1.p2  ORF type:complete len:120 (-),score=25.57 TRINITY_DN31913_c0_g1_i1:202-522(-)
MKPEEFSFEHYPSNWEKLILCYEEKYYKMGQSADYLPLLNATHKKLMQQEDVEYLAYASQIKGMLQKSIKEEGLSKDELEEFRKIVTDKKRKDCLSRFSGWDEKEQ